LVRAVNPLNAGEDYLVRQVACNVYAQTVDLIVIPRVIDEDSIKSSLKAYLSTQYGFTSSRIEVRFLKLFLGPVVEIQYPEESSFSHVVIAFS